MPVEGGPALRTAVRLARLLGRTDTRTVLSILIVLSLCPFPFLDRIWWVFLIIFGVEFGSRATVLAVLRSEGGARRNLIVEALITGLDLIALASFLPLVHNSTIRFLRLARFSRLILLMTYWGGTLRLLWRILNRRERTDQIKLLVASVLGFTFVSAALLAEFAHSENIARDLGISPPMKLMDLIWWSFRQVQDPGNLIGDASHFALMILSLLLTTAGLLLFSFMVGIGTSVVAELVEATRTQPLGDRGHSILINVGEQSYYFLDQAVEHDLKRVRAPLWVAMGREEQMEVLTSARYRRVRYRQGTPYHPEDLAKVDAGAARRIVILADDTLPDPDPDTVSAVLSVRQANPNALIIAELVDEAEALALLSAGGSERTTVVPTQDLLAIVLANLLVRPRHYPVIEDLFTVKGTEIYSYVFDGPQRESLPLLPDRPAATDALFRWMYREFGCTLLATALPDPRDRRPQSSRFRFSFDLVDRTELPAGASLKGLLAVCHSADVVADVAREIEQGAVYWGEGEAGDGVSGGGPADEADPGELPELVVEDESSEPINMLMCGFRHRSALVLEHLLRLSPGARVFVMVSDDQTRGIVRETLLGLGQSLVSFPNPDEYQPGPTGNFLRLDEWELGYRDPDGVRTDGSVHIVTGDWSSRHDLLDANAHGFDLAEASLIFVQADPRGGGDPDARTVLLLMKLQDLYRAGRFRERFSPDLRIVAEINDPLKESLLESRFRTTTDADPLPVEVISVERLRHKLLFQSTVVPGYAAAFTRLFSSDDPSLHRLQPADPGGEGRAEEMVWYGDLMWQMLRRQRLIVVAVELRGPDGSLRVVMGPKPDDPAARFRWGDIQAVYAFGCIHV